jgi:hypothetical protein
LNQMVKIEKGSGYEKSDMRGYRLDSQVGKSREMKNLRREKIDINVRVKYK